MKKTHIFTVHANWSLHNEFIWGTTNLNNSQYTLWYMANMERKETMTTPLQLSILMLHCTFAHELPQELMMIIPDDTHNQHQQLWSWTIMIIKIIIQNKYSQNSGKISPVVVIVPPGARVRPPTNYWVSYQPTIGYLTNQPTIGYIIPTNSWVSYQPTIGYILPTNY